MKLPRTIAALGALFLSLLAASTTNAFDTVVLDPGHGGIDEGTAWYRVKEKDTTLAVAHRLEKLLQNEGIKCVLTRRTDTYISLDDRVKIANRHPDSLLLSIHFDASSRTGASGFSTYYFSQSPQAGSLLRPSRRRLMNRTTHPIAASVPRTTPCWSARWDAPCLLNAVS